MWNGQDMVWDLMAAMYHADLDQDLYQLPKLTVDHIYLTLFSKTKVRLAAQVLSNTVVTALRRHYPNGEGEETAKFCEMVNKFFDCRNTRSTTEHTRKWNECLAPYSSLDDWRSSGCKMYSLHTSMTGTGELQNMQAHLQRMTGERCSSHSKHTKA